MKMIKVEKRLVNSTAHNQKVAAAAGRRLRAVPTQPGQRYLDVGCGNGAAALRIAREFDLNVTGVDVDADRIELARLAASTSSAVEFFVVEFFVADATSLPLDDRSFDIVATNKTMHHIVAWEAAMTELVRVLRPGGYLVFADLVVPPWLAAIVEQLARGYDRRQWTHSAVSLSEWGSAVSASRGKEWCLTQCGSGRRSPKLGLEVAGPIPAHWELHAVRELQLAGARKPRQQLPRVGKVHDRGTANPNESGGDEQCLEFGDRSVCGESLRLRV